MFDFKSKEHRLETEYPLDTPKGVNAFLSNYHYVHAAAYDKGDYDAINMIIDFNIALSRITITQRQREAITLVYWGDLTQREAGEIMGISQQAVQQLLQAVVEKISEQYRKDLEETRGETNVNKLIQAMATKSYYDGFFVGDYTSRLDIEVSKILKVMNDEGNPPSIVERKQIIEAVTDAYIDQTGELPDGVQVQRLGNWLLLEELTNNHPDKVTREEYPFLTKRQLRTRYNRERADEHIPETLTKQKYLGGKKSPIFRKSE